MARRHVSESHRTLDPFAAQCEHGFVKLVAGDWNQAFVDELCAFPNGAHDDCFGCVSGSHATCNVACSRGMKRAASSVLKTGLVPYRLGSRDHFANHFGPGCDR
jgi:hypothetical protein